MKLNFGYSGTPQAAGDSSKERGGRWHKFSRVAPRSRTRARHGCALVVRQCGAGGASRYVLRRLAALHRGDITQVTIPGSQYQHKVVFSSIVSPNETWDLQPTHFTSSAPLQSDSWSGTTIRYGMKCIVVFAVEAIAGTCPSSPTTFLLHSAAH